MGTKLPKPVWVDTPTGLQIVVADLAKQLRIAVDTESNSLHAYREQVCLIQFSTTKVDYLVDPLALDDLSLLGKIFANPKIEKVFHAAEYDLICLKRDFGFTVTNLFDTRWAVRVLGYPRDGLDGILAEKFDVKVDKKYQKSNWAERPLSPEKINYARLDTHYLLPLSEMLKTELEEKGLWQLAYEDFQRASVVEIPSSKASLWERMASHNSLSIRELTILKELFDCREKIAEQLDRPTFKVISDKHLYEIAQQGPEYLDELYGVGLSHRQVERWGRPLLQAVEKGQAAPPVKRPQAERPDDAFLNRLDALKHWRKKVAREMGVESDVVLPRNLMNMLAEEAPDNIKTLAKLLSDTSWRMSHFGPQILKALRGKE